MLKQRNSENRLLSKCLLYLQSSLWNDRQLCYQKVSESDYWKLWDLFVTENPSSYRNLMRTISHCFIRLVKGLLCPWSLMFCFLGFFLQSLWIENKYYSSHFSDEETEGQKSKVILRSQRNFHSRSETKAQIFWFLDQDPFSHTTLLLLLPHLI